MISDPIGDMLIRIKNAYLARHKSLELPYSTFKEDLAKFLVKHGFLEKVSVSGKDSKKNLNLELKYNKRKGVLTDVRRISKPGLKVYVGVDKISHRRRGKLSVVVLSTPYGLMSGEEAKKKNTGGEFLAEVW